MTLAITLTALVVACLALYLWITPPKPKKPKKPLYVPICPTKRALAMKPKRVLVTPIGQPYVGMQRAEFVSADAETGIIKAEVIFNQEMEIPTAIVEMLKKKRYRTKRRISTIDQPAEYWNVFKPTFLIVEL